MISRYSVMCAAMCAAAALLGAAGAAHADSDVKSSDIVDFFVKSAEGNGATRGICIGTAQECQPAEAKPAGLDMLINFELDSAELTPQARQNLAEFAKALKDQRLATARFSVEGYTDGRGSDQYNLGLSERRAQAVTAFLRGSGVPEEKIEAVGLGEQNPRVADPMDPVNRRVEMRIKLQ